MEPGTEPTYTIISGGRPIDEPNPCNFMPNDKVYIRAVGNAPREGPYTVSWADQGVYKLCDARGRTIMNGKTFGDTDLEEYNEFE
ncbi:hypothetical protein FVEN_g5677 [Fusarium venenatum]|uniref:Uncharacterized protein n=1 Tax=Fusarium venenatum TaxID=56646 RepID=A0A2L2TU14_9HYPO|nr:uncharacterized protein FVRRES_04098 [Fusarium venenatum]KAG8356590.1 hypothetical protein FVEN_g5677 [Fusarium venenatum]CEI67586.1 unnamed protein product [Fusarium venenatum]